jgi:ubiquinone/menaquinone biosynthesis C-methylase UbiE
MQPQDKNPPQNDQWGQYRYPAGVLGRTVAASMNSGHWDLTTWGLKHVCIKPGFVVLDVGCGGGKTISRLSRRASRGKVYGLDQSDDMVEYSRQTNRKLNSQNRVEIVHGSVEKTVFKDEFFDLVTAVETYYFWPNLVDAFIEMKRVLKKGGYLLIVNEMIADGTYEVENAELIAKTQVHLVPLNKLEIMLHSAGFSIVKVYRKRKSVWNALLALKS